MAPAAAHRFLAAAALLTLATGCAEHLRLRHEEPTVFWTGRLFWPPPLASSVWVGEPPAAPGRSLIEAAAQLVEHLDGAGYDDLRLVPIGLGYAHGFALVTRLERLGPASALSDGRARAWEPGVDRWLSSYPHPPSMRWLAFATEPPMPAAGRTRTLLVAFTDLPVVDRHRPPIESEETVMDGPDVPASVPLPRRRVTPLYRVSLHVYEFEARSAGEHAPMLDESNASEPASTTAEALSL